MSQPKWRLKTRLWVTWLDIENKLKELGINNPTEEQCKKVALSNISITCAWSSAHLQDLTKEELENILNDN